MTTIGNQFKAQPDAWAQAAIAANAVTAGTQNGKGAKITRQAQGVYLVTCDAGGFGEMVAGNVQTTSSYELCVHIKMATFASWTLDPGSTATVKQINVFDAAGAALDIDGELHVSLRRLAI